MLQLVLSDYLHCDALQRTALHCNAQQRTATRGNALQRSAPTLSSIPPLIDSLNISAL